MTAFLAKTTCVRSIRTFPKCLQFGNNDVCEKVAGHINPMSDSNPLLIILTYRLNLISKVGGVSRRLVEYVYIPPLFAGYISSHPAPFRQPRKKLEWPTCRLLRCGARGSNAGSIFVFFLTPFWTAFGPQNGPKFVPKLVKIGSVFGSLF